MLHWSLLNLQNPELMANIGEPPAAPTIGIPDHIPMEANSGAHHAENGIQPENNSAQAAHGSAQSNGEAQMATGGAQPDSDIPANHALPAAYLMWKDLAKYMKERASQWEEQEFRYRKERAAILYEIQREQIQKALLESALEEFHRQEELLELERMLRRHQLRGG